MAEPSDLPEGAGPPSEPGAGFRAREAESQLQEAVRLKVQGNGRYREGRYRDAIGQYHRALLLLRGLDPDVTTPLESFRAARVKLNPQQEEVLRGTQVDCYNNLAACLLRRQPVCFARVREYSVKALQWQPGSVKALYRAGVATLELGDPETALQYLSQASRGQPNDPNVKKHIEIAEERMSKNLQREKALYRGMFN